MNEMGIAGWLFHRAILHDQTMKQLDMPGVCKSLGVDTIELVSSFFPSQNTKYLNQLRAALHEHGVRVRSIAVDMGDIANPDEAIRRTDIEGLKQWFYVARAYSCHVKVFSYSPDGMQSWAGRDGQPHSYNLKQSLQILKDAKYAGPLYIEAGASATEEDSARDAIRYVRDLWATL